MILLPGRLFPRNFLALIAFVCASATFALSPQHAKKTAPAESTPTPSAAKSESIFAAPAISRPHPEYQFPIGETYIYGAVWRIFDAGIATLRMEQAGPEDRVVATADAAGTISLLYHVQDKLESFFDPATFCSHSASRHLAEGFRRVETNITFDYQRNKVLLDHRNLKKNEKKHEEHDIPGCVTDMLSAVYYVASLPLQPGKTYDFPINDGGPMQTVAVHVEAREAIKTPAGTFNTVRVQPETVSGALRDKGKVWIWYSDDAARIPVQMRARLSWGTLTFSLLRIEKK